MIVKLIDISALQERHAYWGTRSLNLCFSVVAIGHFRKRRQYLVENSEFLYWWDADLFEVVDETFPAEWVEVQYKRFYKLRNKKYSISIPLNYYLGPRSFLENADFFFDIYENPRIAYNFFKHCIYGKKTD